MRGSRPNGHHFLFLFLFLALRSALPDGRFVVDATPTLKPLTKELTHGIMPRIMSLRDLSAFDGSDVSLPIYIAVRGVIFDVTEGKRFYGKGAAYNALAGGNIRSGVKSDSGGWWRGFRDLCGVVAGGSDSLLASGGR